MAHKVGFWSNTFETLEKFGKDTAKETARGVADTVNPFKKEKTINPEEQEEESHKMEKKKRREDFTPLDIEKLHGSYKSEDEMKAQALRQRLFQLVKKQEKDIMEEDEKQKEEKKLREEQEEEERRKKEKERLKQEQESEIPKGKDQRGSAFAAKKKKKPANTIETKVGKGKQ